MLHSVLGNVSAVKISVVVLGQSALANSPESRQIVAVKIPDGTGKSLTGIVSQTAFMNSVQTGRAVDAPTSRPPLFGGQPAFFANGGLCPFQA